MINKAEKPRAEEIRDEFRESTKSVWWLTALCLSVHFCAISVVYQK